MPRPRSSHSIAPALLRQAAWMRAQGFSWEAVAKDVGYAVRVVQTWPRKHPRRWQTLLHAAQAEQTDEAVAESVRTLRKQLRSDDEKTSRDAAQKLLAYSTALRKPRSEAKQPTKPEPLLPSGGTFARLATFLERLNDDDLAKLVAELDPQAIPEKSQAVSVTSAPGPPRRVSNSRCEHLS